MKQPDPASGDDAAQPSGGAFPIRLLIAASVLTILVLGSSIVRDFNQQRDLQQIGQVDLELSRLSEQILLYDEVLTSSVRLAAATGDDAWRERYIRHEAILAEALGELESSAEAIGYDFSAIQVTAQANTQLVEWEQRAFALISQGRRAEAEALLSSDDYREQKQLYLTGMETVLADLRSAVEARLDRGRAGGVRAFAGFGLLLVVVAVTWIAVARGIRGWRHSLEQANRIAEDANRRLEARVDALGRLNQQLEDVNRVAANDLKQPLRTIHGFTKMIEEGGGLSEEQADFSRRVRTASEHLTLLIDDLQVYSTLTSAGVPSNNGPVALDAVIDHIRDDLLAAQIEAEGVKLVASDLAELDCDETLITQVLVNLIGNSIRFRSEEPPRIVVARFEAPDFTEIRVCDNGIGIAPSDQERVFQLFTRLDPRSEDEGTGVGLAIVKKAAEAMGGHIEVQSQKGQGACFSLVLPRQAAVGNIQAV